MKSLRLIYIVITLLLGPVTLPLALSADFKPEPGYISLFNGKDLTGWGYLTNNFDGKKESSNGRYAARDGVLVVNPKEPQLMEILWTTREFPKDFILKLEQAEELAATVTNRALDLAGFENKSYRWSENENSSTFKGNDEK